MKIITPEDTTAVTTDDDVTMVVDITDNNAVLKARFFKKGNCVGADTPEKNRARVSIDLEVAAVE